MEATTAPSGEGGISERKSHQDDTGEEYNDPAHGHLHQHPAWCRGSHLAPLAAIRLNPDMAAPAP
jgi:hypothetical protein